MKPAAPARVRIIGGQWRRSLLPVPDSPGLRPTPDRVRETVFNWLGQDLPGWAVLDLFAGSGAMAFEAASRGANPVTLVEQSPRISRTLEQNRERLNASMIDIVTADALDWLRRTEPRPIRLMLMDPPYGQQLPERCLELIAARPGWLAEPAWIYVEREAAIDEAWLEARRLPGLRLHRSARAGQVHYHLLHHEAA